jgi:hypothetical protein
MTERHRRNSLLATILRPRRSPGRQIADPSSGKVAAVSQHQTPKQLSYDAISAHLPAWLARYSQPLSSPLSYVLQTSTAYRLALSGFHASFDEIVVCYVRLPMGRAR